MSVVAALAAAALAAAALLAGCNGARAGSQAMPAQGSGDAAQGASAAGDAAPAAPATPRTAELLAAMSTLMGLPSDAGHVAEWAQKIDSGAAPVDGYIDELIATERFAQEVIPGLVFASFVNVRNYYAVPSAFVLKHAPGPGAPLYLRTPCAESDAVAVHPWWDLRSEVKVCPDSYRPNKWTLLPNEHSYRTQMTLSCDSQVGSPELETNSLCGCGPSLIRCLRDDDQYNEFNKSFMDEVKRTTAYVVEHDLPIATLFTATSTFRDRNVELYYRRQKIGTLERRSREGQDDKREREALERRSREGQDDKREREALESDRVKHELADLDDWPAEGKWAPREEVRPGQHAGLLTAPQILHSLPDRRQRQRGYYEILWCNLRNSFGATTHKVLEINSTGNNFFVHDSWERLAHTELCMNCHARLDYGTQFFLGYPDSRASVHFIPSLQATGTGPLYGRDIHDLRGDAPLTPIGFAKLATEQPDFGSCMARHFVSYALGGRATDDDVAAIETAVNETKKFKPVMKVALQRYAARWREDARAVAPATLEVVHALPGPTGGVAVSPALRAKLDQHCGECHDEVPYSNSPEGDTVPFDFTGSELPRSLVVNMADHVAFGMMPKDRPLDLTAREEVVGLLIDSLWADPAARGEARRYYLGGARGLPAQQFDNALYMIDRAAGARSDIGWGALERGVWSDQSTITPGFLALTGLEALRACMRATEAGGGALEACVAKATSVRVLSRWPLPAPAP